ncbi:MAG: hypothetical protein QF575_00995 [Acidimicrobiales bacterium]|nr:hypothetical protein [Acidimicrobiales bacterium]
MTDADRTPSILALHLGLLEAHAAVDRDGRIDLVALGEGRAGMPLVLHVAADGDVAVGDPALQRADEHPEGFVEDVMGRLLDDGVITASGRTLAAEVVLAHLLAQAYARCVEVLDGAPDQLLVVRPAGGPEAETYAAAAGRGLVGDIRVLDETRAWAAFSGHAPPGAKGMEPERTGALGALLWLRHGDAPTGPMPIVTREDLDGIAPAPARQPAPPSVVSVGPRSVFEAPPSTPPPSMPAPPGRPPRRAPVPFLVLLLLLVVGAIAWVVDPGDDEAGPPVVTLTPTSTAPTTVPPTTEPPTTEPPTTEPPTTEPPTTEPPTTEESTTTTEPPTTEESTTTTTTTEPPPTTTRPPLGPVSISDVGLLLHAASDASQLLELGMAAGDVLDGVTGALGAPDVDTGWTADAACEADLVRRVRYAGLELVLVDPDPTDAPPTETMPEGEAAEESGGEGGGEGEGAEEGEAEATTTVPPGVPGYGATFAQWFLSGADSVDSGHWTLERIGIGSTVADMRLAYPDGFSITQAVEGDPAGFFGLDAVGIDTGISGATSNTSESGQVLQLWAGDACSRLFG